MKTLHLLLLVHLFFSMSIYSADKEVSQNSKKYKIIKRTAIVTSVLAIVAGFVYLFSTEKDESYERLSPEWKSIISKRRWKEMTLSNKESILFPPPPQPM